MFKQHHIDSKLITYADIFERCLDAVQIEDNGRLVIHDKGNFSVEVRGRTGYSSGTHRFRFQIEASSLGTWIFFGIISKSTSMNKNSYESSSAYGWADYNDYFLAGVRQYNQNTGQFSHTLENDIISLVLDCTNRTIYYTNERNQKNQQLNIDIEKCPFPWHSYTSMFLEMVIKYGCLAS